MSDILTLDALSLAKAIAAGDTTAVEATEAVLGVELKAKKQDFVNLSEKKENLNKEENKRKESDSK